MERPCPANLVRMHFTATSTCINFISQFNFLTTRTTCIVHGQKGNFGQIWSKKMSKNLQNRKGHTQIFWADSILTPMDYSPWSKREIWLFLKQTKGTKSPTLERSLSPKLVFMHFTSTSTCTYMNCLSWFYFSTPTDYSEGEFLEKYKKEKNLRNRRGHTHQSWCKCISHQHKFLSWLYFLNPWSI